MSLSKILEKGSELTKDDIVFLLKLNESSDLLQLYNKAKEVKENIWGLKVNFNGVLRFSNFCEDNCLFCGYREDNFSINRFRMSADEILDAVRHISNLGLKSVTLQSGKDNFYDTDIIAYIIYTIKSELNISISLSLRERGFDEYRAWKLAGAERYILNHEISNSDLFSKYHQKNIISNRNNILTYLSGLKYLVGSGTIIGLPDQSELDIADDLLMLKFNNIETVTITPFLTIPFTPYQNRIDCSREDLLKVLAITRILMPKANIPTSTTFDKLNSFGIEDAISVGANVAQVYFTPNNYQGRFSPSVTNAPIFSNEWESFTKIKSRLESNGIFITQENNSL